jgi:hypothetical protein
MSDKRRASAFVSTADSAIEGMVMAAANGFVMDGGLLPARCEEVQD